MTEDFPGEDIHAGYLTDSEVIVSSLEDPTAFAELFDRHGAALFRYVASRAGHDRAQDVLSAAFATAFDCRTRFDTTRPDARPWLFGIATNELRNHLRTERRHRRLIDRLPRHGRLEIEPSLDDELLDRLEAEKASAGLAEALRTLSAGDRDVLLLFAWAELSYEEIATSLNLPVGTVKSRLNRSRRRMRDAMESNQRSDDS